MTADQVIKAMNGLSNADIVEVVAEGKQILEARFADEERRLLADHKRMLAEAVSGRKRKRDKAPEGQAPAAAGKEKTNAVSQAA